MFAKNINIANWIFSTLIFFQLLTTTGHGFGNDCDFSYLIQEVPLLSKYTIDKTEECKANKKYWQLAETVLPNVKRVFFSEGPYFSVFLGWHKSLDNFENYTKEQIEDHFTSLVETYQSSERLKGGEYSLSFSHDDPLAMYMTVTYVDGGKSYKDIAMDIIATPNNVVSIKISGRTDELGKEYWTAFDEQFELIREIIKEKYGVVQFSSVGYKIWWSLLLERLFWIFIIAGSAFSISRIYLRKFTLTPSSTTRKYSVFIIIMAIIMVAATIWLNEPTNRLRYEYIPHFIIIYIIHLWAFFTNRPKIVSFSLWFMVVTLFSHVMYGILGWVSFTEGTFIGVFIGSILVVYTLVESSSSLKKVVATISEKSDEKGKEFYKRQDTKILFCPECDFSVNEEEFTGSEYFCPHCKSQLILKC